MSELVTPSDKVVEEGITAILGVVLLTQGGEVRVPRETLEDGLPENSRVQVFFDESADELVVRIAENAK